MERPQSYKEFMQLFPDLHPGQDGLSAVPEGMFELASSKSASKAVEGGLMSFLRGRVEPEQTTTPSDELKENPSPTEGEGELEQVMVLPEGEQVGLDYLTSDQRLPDLDNFVEDEGDSEVEEEDDEVEKNKEKNQESNSNDRSMDLVDSNKTGTVGMNLNDTSKDSDDNDENSSGDKNKDDTVPELESNPANTPTEWVFPGEVVDVHDVSGSSTATRVIRSSEMILRSIRDNYNDNGIGVEADKENSGSKPMMASGHSSDEVIPFALDDDHDYSVVQGRTRKFS